MTDNFHFWIKGGDVVVFTGLLDFVENDDELSIILAHEMSHVGKFYNQKILNAFYLIFSLFRLFYNMQ